MSARNSLLKFMLVVVLLTTAPLTANEVTITSLLREMADLDRLAELPDPAYTTRQASSYDRASTDPAQRNDQNWFANADAAKHIRAEQREERTEHVMLDTEGPGTIVRVWSANPKNGGIIRFYLDNAEEPAIALPLEQFLSGKTEIFIDPFGGERASGYNLYFPIPYATHCKITVDRPNIYYHIGYRTYEPGTDVETFNMQNARDALLQIHTTQKKLSHPLQAAHRGPEPRHQLALSQNLATNETLSANLSEEGRFLWLFPRTQPQAIRRLAARVQANDTELALRQCVLTINFDNADSLQVNVPLGDFFGTLGLHPYTSLPVGVLKNGTLYAHWVMPFRDNAKISVTNHGEQEAQIDLGIEYAPHDWGRNTCHFNAGWRSATDLPVWPRQDWNLVTVDGAGRYVGNMLHIKNPVTAWWGEGDEKIYIDGEAFPSTFGTGTEDYYGYAWCNNTTFTHAYHSQPRADGPANYGHVVNSRFHVFDDLPFREGIRFDMEIWHHVIQADIDYATTSFWYARPGASDNLTAPATSELTIGGFDEPTTKTGVIEAETLHVLADEGGAHFEQYRYVPGWSRGYALWWTLPKPAQGKRIYLTFENETAGKHQILAAVTKSPISSRYAVTLNGQPLSEINLHDPHWINAGEVSLGVAELKEGINTFGFTSLQEDPAKQEVLVIDYLRIKSAP